MGSESAIYFVRLRPGGAETVVHTLERSGAERTRATETWVDLRLHDQHRYWIDLRVHHGAEPRLEVRIALTNDEWSIRAPLEQALRALPLDEAEPPLHDEDGVPIAALDADGWPLRLEDDYGRRRAEFVARVGEYTAPISADHVYMYIHQIGRRYKDAHDLARKRDREINKMEQMWDPPAEPPDSSG